MRSRLWQAQPNPRPSAKMPALLPLRQPRSQGSPSRLSPSHHGSPAVLACQSQRIGTKNEGDEVDQAAGYRLHQHRDVVGGVLGRRVGQGLAVKEGVHATAGLEEEPADDARLGSAAARGQRRGPCDSVHTDGQIAAKRSCPFSCHAASHSLPAQPPAFSAYAPSRTPPGLNKAHLQSKRS